MAGTQDLLNGHAMKVLVRSSVAVISASTAHCFLYSLPFSLIFPSGGFRFARLSLSLLCGIVVGVYTWRHTASSESQRLISCVALGAIVTGAVGFSLGFFGPMIVAPGANQGPLLGLFITGPLGFVLGAIGGGVYWSAHRQ